MKYDNYERDVLVEGEQLWRDEAWALSRIDYLNQLLRESRRKLFGRGDGGLKHHSDRGRRGRGRRRGSAVGAYEIPARAIAQAIAQRAGGVELEPRHEPTTGAEHAQARLLRLTAAVRLIRAVLGRLVAVLRRLLLAAH